MQQTLNPWTLIDADGSVQEFDNAAPMLDEIERREANGCAVVAFMSPRGGGFLVALKSAETVTL